MSFQEKRRKLLTVDLIKLEQQGLAEMNAGHLDNALKYFLKLARNNPMYEQGIIFYHIAGIYEDLGEIQKAEQYYKKALKLMPSDPIRIGGYASFLYLHGDPLLAFKFFETILRIELGLGQNQKIKDTVNILKTLGKKIGFSEGEINNRIHELKKYS